MNLMNTPPKVSVVMSVYNGEKYLREAIDSILNQTFTYFEFIIIDDGSIDKSEHIIKSYIDPRIVLIQQKNKGLAAALNTGIKAAKGKYIARMDADDISEPERLKKQYEFMQLHDECVAAGTNAIILDEDGNNLYSTSLHFNYDISTDYLMEKNPFIHGSMMLMREVVLDVGGYNQKIKHFSEDDLLWVELSKRGKMYVLTDVLYRWRIVHSSISHMLPRQVRNRLLQIRKRYAQIGFLSDNDVKFINDLKDNRSIAKKKSDYSFHIGRILLNINKINSRKWFVRAFVQSPINIVPLVYLILSYLPDKALYKLKCYKNILKSEVITNCNF